MAYASGSAAMHSSGDAGSASADASQLGGSSADASQLGGSSAVYCPACDMWLNGMGQYNDHVLRKKHRQNLNKRVGHEQRDRRDKGFVIPRGTAIIIEQGAILSDATELGQPAQFPDAAVSSVSDQLTACTTTGDAAQLPAGSADALAVTARLMPEHVIAIQQEEAARGGDAAQLPAGSADALAVTARIMPEHVIAIQQEEAGRGGDAAQLPAGSADDLAMPRGIIIEQGAILSDATELGHVGSASADAFQLGGSSADASQLGGSSAVYCPACEMWLNDMGEYNDHVLHKKHRNLVQVLMIGCL